MEEFSELLPRLNMQVYEDMRSSAECNLREAMRYMITEDWIYENVLRGLR